MKSGAKILWEELQSDMKNLPPFIRFYTKNVSKIIVSTTVLEKQNTDCERLIENVEDSSAGGFHVEIDWIGVNVVDEVDNAELKEYLTNIEEIKLVSDAGSMPDYIT